MTDNQNNREKSYKRELESRRDTAREKSEPKPNETPEEKESLFRKMGQGKLGRYGKAAIAAGTLAGAQPGGAQMSEDSQIAEEMRKNQQQETTQQYEEPKQNQAERMFGEGATMSERTEPYNAVNFEDINKKEDQQTLGEDLKRKPAPDYGEQAKMSRISTPGGGTPGELLQVKPHDDRQLNKDTRAIDETPLGQEKAQTEDLKDNDQGQHTDGKKNREGGEKKSDLTDKALSAGKGAASVGQAAGKGAEFAGKGTQVAGKGMEAGGRAVQKGGQAMTKAGAELSATGAGAIVGVPLAVAGAATTATGAGVQAAGKGAQTAGKGIERGGKVVAQGSKTTKNAIDKTKDIKQSVGTPKGDAPGERYMNLARQLTEAKNKAQEGDIVGVVKGGIDVSIQLSTARALSVAWYSLIPTFGLSVLYINFHFVAHYFAHSPKFCGFGEEWMIRKMAKSGGAAQAIKEAGRMLEIAEVGGMIVVNVLIAIFIFIVMTFGYFIMNPIEGFELLV